MENVYVMSATRSAIGSFGGALKDKAPIELGTIIAQEAISRSGFDKNKIDHAVFGNVIHTEPRDMYLSRCISMDSGVSESAPALTVNRLCGSGLQAIVSAIQLIQLGDAKITLAGGVEIMSKSGYLVPAMRWGGRLGDAKMTDMLIGALHDPFGLGHMGITAENVSKDYEINREMMDNFALSSQQKAFNAIDKGYFSDQITSIEIKKRKEKITFKIDEHIRPNTKIENLSALKPAFDPNGNVTAGNSSGINDGAAALILTKRKKQ